MLPIKERTQSAAKKLNSPIEFAHVRAVSVERKEKVSYIFTYLAYVSAEEGERKGEFRSIFIDLAHVSAVSMDGKEKSSFISIDFTHVSAVGVDEMERLALPSSTSPTRVQCVWEKIGSQLQILLIRTCACSDCC